VFAASAVRTLPTTPEIVIPTFGIVPLAIVVGLMLYRWRVNTIFATALGVILLFWLVATDQAVHHPSGNPHTGICQFLGQ